MKDRNVEFPNRYRLVRVEGTADIFDLVPAPGVISNEGTFINKSTLLKDATAALFGLGVDAVPDDVLRVLSRFQRNLGNEYVWAKLGKTVSLGSAQTDKAILIYKTLYYSDRITDSGELIDPQFNGALQIMTQEAVMAELKGLTGKYFYFTGSATTTHATLIPDDTVFYMESCNPVVMSGTDNSVYTGAVYRSVSIAVDTTYVNSLYADTYPPTVSDGYTYTALGRLGNKVQIATGSYTGTGTYGASNPCSLKFDFEPKIIIIPFYYAGNYWSLVGHGSNGSSIQTGIMVGSTLTTSWQKDIGFGLPTNSGGKWCDRYGRKLADGTVQWYSTGDDMAQFNESGWKYHYIAIG